MNEKTKSTFVAVACCNDVSVLVLDDRMLCVCPNHPPTVIESSGKSHTLQPSEKLFVFNEDKP